MHITDLHFAYDDSSRIFQGFNLNISSRLAFLQGRSGCGKTTLLKLITGNLNAQSGNIKKLFEGGSCLILQEDALFPWLSGLENIKRILGLSEPKIIAHGMYPYVHSFIHQKACTMSFGQRRLVELFRAIMYEPALLCLDEPFNYLDQGSRKFVADILFSDDFLPVETQIIMTTHYHSDIAELGASQYSLFRFDQSMPYASLEKIK